MPSFWGKIPALSLPSQGFFHDDHGVVPVFNPLQHRLAQAGVEVLLVGRKQVKPANLELFRCAFDRFHHLRSDAQLTILGRHVPYRQPQRQVGLGVHIMDMLLAVSIGCPSEKVIRIKGMLSQLRCP